jgi:hypothetical protein
MKEIIYRGERIAVHEVEEMGGDLDDLRDFTDTLLRGKDGTYYLRQVRLLKMSPNAEEIYSERVKALGYVAANSIELRRLRAFRNRHQKPRVTIKRIKEKTALLWCVHQMLNDARIKARLLEIIKRRPL